MLQKGGEVYKGNIASLSIIMALTDAVKIKTISCFNQAWFKNINEGFFPVCFVLWFSLCFAMLLLLLLFAAKSFLVIHHITALTTAHSCQNTKLVFLNSSYQLSSRSPLAHIQMQACEGIPDVHLWKWREGVERRRDAVSNATSWCRAKQELLLLASLQKRNFKRLNVSLQENAQK